MHYDAALRVRELTQNIYDIGDEIADYINHVSQAIADWDADLVEDCLLELEELSLIHISEPTRRHHVSRMPSSA